MQIHPLKKSLVVPSSSHCNTKELWDPLDNLHGLHVNAIQESSNIGYYIIYIYLCHLINPWQDNQSSPLALLDNSLFLSWPKRITTALYKACPYSHAPFATVGVVILCLTKSKNSKVLCNLWGWQWSTILQWIATMPVYQLDGYMLGTPFAAYGLWYF